MSKIVQPTIILRGFCMGIADIIPGISGGTVALIVGIYHRLLKSLSSFDLTAIDHLKNRRLRELCDYLDLFFLINIFVGIFSAIISMSHLVHYLFANWEVYTWSFFFGLISASIIYLYALVDNKKIQNLVFIPMGVLVGHGVISLTPVDTPTNPLFIILSGFIAICAMILPGISGSFLLLILGKYIYITSAVKNIFAEGSIAIVIQFLIGAALGLLSFSKLLNYLLKRFPHKMMFLLTGFMIGALPKIWPWRVITDSIIVRGKTKVLSEKMVLPQTFDQTTFLALTFIILGFTLIFILQKLGSSRGVSSAG